MEYWLQKKTIGGWSHVTWYDSYEQAKLNFDKVSPPNNGYSWRIIEAKTLDEKMLEEAVVVEAPNQQLEAAKRNVWAGQATTVQDNAGWGIPSHSWGKPKGFTSDNPKPIGTPSAAGPVAIKSDSGYVHGMTGKVWMINHVKKLRARIDANSVAVYEKDGFVRGGPKTAFVE